VNAPLAVQLPTGLAPERRYAVDVVLNHFLGLPYRVQPATVAGANWIRLSTPDGRSLYLPDVFFAGAEPHWRHKRSLPNHMAGTWRQVRQIAPDDKSLPQTLPILFGRALPQGGWWQTDGTTAQLGIDVFGTAFFGLSRYEETTQPSPALDVHGRFPAAASIAAALGLLERPFVDEAIAVFAAALQLLWPEYRQRRWRFAVVPSHDIDEPFAFALHGPLRAIRRVGGDIVRRRNLRRAYDTARHYLAFLRGAPDPYDTYTWLLLQAERAGWQTTFNFMAAHPWRHDPGYAIEHPHVQARIDQIRRRGHAIGFHPSYRSIDAPQRWDQEWQRLRTAVSGPIYGGRQHFLRFCVPHTWRLWADHGFAYDSTLGFADHIGFRAGTSRPFPVFDIAARRTLPLLERPLVAMDTTLTKHRYMRLGTGTEAWERLIALKDACRRHGGEFTLLWHNARLWDGEQRALYRALIGADGA